MEKEKDNNSYSHILKYAGIFGGVQGLNVLVGVVRNKFTALFLGPSGMGLLSLFNSTLSLLSASCNFGIPISGVQVIAQSKNISMVRTFCFLSALLGAVVCLVLGPFLNFFTFSWGNHTLHFIFLAPTVFFTILAGGELAILKGMGRLRELVFQASILAVLSLLFSIPIYGFFGESGILAVLFLLAFSQWALGLFYVRRVSPFRLDFSRQALLQGLPMMRVGLSFVLSGVMVSGAEFLVRAFLNQQGDLEMVGLFNAGVTITLVYGGMIFSVMDSDYYPRLSAVGGERRSEESERARNAIINKQLRVNILLSVPVILLMVFLLPYLIPLLYNEEFMGMLRMAQIASVGLLFKAIYMPVEYIPLSRGDAKVFLLQESVAVLLLIGFEIGGYWLYGLTGIGVGILAAYAVETIFVLLLSHFYYGWK